MAKKKQQEQPIEPAPETGAIDYSALGDGPYRVHFHNGQSGEYSGAAMKYGSRPFHDRQVKSIEPIIAPGSEIEDDSDTS